MNKPLRGLGGGRVATMHGGRAHRATRGVAFSLCLAWAICASSAPAVAQAVGAIVSFSGTVEAKTAVGAWALVKQTPVPLFGGDVVRTGADGSCVVVINGTQIRIHSNSIVRVPEAGNRRGIWGKLTVLLGKIGVWLLGDRKVEIVTPAAKAAASGTAFQVEVSEDGRTIVTVAEGTVQVYNDLGSVQVAANQQTIVIPGQAPSPPIAVDASQILIWEAALPGLPLKPEVRLAPEVPLPLLERARQAAAAARAAPEDEAAQLFAAALCHDAGDLAQAEELARAAIRLVPDAPQPRAFLAVSLLSAGRPAEAAAAAAETPAGAWRDFATGLVKLASGDAEAALPALEAAAAEIPEAHLHAAVAAARLGRAETAQRHAEAAASDYRALALRATLALSAGDLESAARLAADALAANEACATAQEAAAAVAMFRGQLDEARSHAARAIEANPASASALAIAADIAALSDDLDTAQDLAARAVALDPNFGPAWRILGTVYNALGAYPQAARALERAVKLQPAMLSAYSTLAVVYSKQGKIAQALSQFQTAFALGSENAQMENDYGALLVNLGRIREGIEHLEKAVAMTAERGQPWAMPMANLAIAHLDLNQFAQAERWTLRALELAPRSAPVRTVAARVFMAQRRYQRALAELREALQIDRDYALARVKLSNLYHLLQQDREAYKEMLRAGLTDAGALVEERLYSRTEVEISAGSSQAFVKTDGRAAEGRVAYYFSAVQSDAPSWLPNGDWTDRTAQFLAGRYNSDGSRDFLRATYSATTTGRPGSTEAPDLDYRYRTFEASLDFSRQFPATGLGRFFVLGHYDRVAERATNPDSMQPPGRTGGLDTKPYLWRRADATRYGAEVAWMGRLGTWDAIAGAAGQWGNDEAAGALWQLPGVKAAQQVGEHVPFAAKDYRDLATAYLNLSRRFGADSIEIGGQVVTSDGSSSNWRPRLVWEHVLAPGRRLWGGTYTVAREDVGLLSPTNPWRQEHELEWTNFAPGGYGQFYEGRYEILGTHSMLDLVLFYRDYDGLLVPLADPQLDGEPPYLVVFDGRAYGGEVTFERALSPELTVSGQATYTNSRDEGRGEDIPFVPDWQGRLALHYKDSNGWRIEAVWRYTGSRADAVGAELGGFGVFDLYLSRQFSPRLEVFARGTNLFDRTYEYWPGYVQLGRHIVAGARYRF